MSETRQETEIPLHLATVRDIADELDSRQSPTAFMLSHKLPDGRWRTLIDGMTIRQRADLLQILQKAHDLDRRSAGGDFAGRLGDHAFEGCSWEHGKIPLWRRVPDPIRTAVWFLLACFTVAAMLRCLK